MITEAQYAVLNAIMTRNSQATFRQIVERVLARSEADVRSTVDQLKDMDMLLVVENGRRVMFGLSMKGFTAWNTFK